MQSVTPFFPGDFFSPSGRTISGDPPEPFQKVQPMNILSFSDGSVSESLCRHEAVSYSTVARLCHPRRTQKQKAASTEEQNHQTVTTEARKPAPRKSTRNTVEKKRSECQREFWRRQCPRASPVATGHHEWPTPQSRASGLQNGIFSVHSQNHPQQEKRAMGRKETLSSNMHASTNTEITTIKRFQAADHAKAAKFPFDFRANGDS